MTLPDQTRAMAELDGFHTIQPNPLYPDRLAGFKGSDTTAMLGVPDYSTRDAVISVIEKQDSHTRFKIWEMISGAEQCYYDVSHLDKIGCASVEQLREALLRATGKWKES